MFIQSSCLLPGFLFKNHKLLYYQTGVILDTTMTTRYLAFEPSVIMRSKQIGLFESFV